MVNAVIEWKGGDGFAAASRALHCGVRKVVVPVIEMGRNLQNHVVLK